MERLSLSRLMVQCAFLLLLLKSATAQIVAPHANSDKFDSTPSAADIERFAAAPGSIVTHSKNGSSHITKLQRGGVSIEITQDKGVSRITKSIDASGHGAIGCAWALYVAVRADIDNCFPDRYRNLRSGLTTSINSIALFIVENNLVGLTRREVDAATSELDQAYRTYFSRMTPEQRNKLCNIMGQGDLTPFMQMTESRLQSDTSALLSIPRPPVMARCL